MTKSIIVQPFESKGSSGESLRSPKSQLEEAVGLSAAIDLEVVHASLVPLKYVRPATYIGGGKIDELVEIIKEEEIVLCVVNAGLSPVQQRNLEKRLKVKVIDRTALILEIFGARARTKEGRLQVELAALEYQKSRLVRSWTHLERQRGGGGFMGGPGESQIELDRRLIKERIAVIKKQLEKVVRTRTLHRKRRKDVPYPLVALVGYTNAGKSTLFNRLTGADVLSEDALFATLDPTIRKVTLPSGLEIMLSDTVGFISDLPTHLVAAFKATLEEVLEADVILHVRDMSHKDNQAQKQDVDSVLKSLYDSDCCDDVVKLEIYNKCDLLDDGEMVALQNKSQDQNAIISAATGYGIDNLLDLINKTITDSLFKTVQYKIDYTDGEAMAWLYRNGDVLENQDNGEYITLKVRLSPADIERFNSNIL